ncbi:M23 family metallopeptidase [Psychromonas antarctica]|uniref:M23 family metallopeptidase n=1 Tax=Psychromonas antarctica TaxID=67573 RepID=UPI0023AE8F01|nr:M23 family metallopeptidase [Psychromonas antarctica]
MSITFIYSREEAEHSFSLTKNKFLLISLLFAILLIACAWFIQAHYQSQLNQFKITALHDRDISKDQYLQLIKAQNDETLAVLATKVGNLQAQLNRLNALGERVIEQSNLPKKEFDFELPLPMGGIDPSGEDLDYEFPDLLNHIENLDQDFKNKQKQLMQLEITLNNRHLIDQLYISGRPTKGRGSWVSSPFGIRKDPFSGRLTRHKGVDIAGFMGMPIISTAAGVVTESGKRSGYGLMVEIQHGNGFVTRYAHASALNVSVGDIVSKGQTVAVMGSSGRSTGPHVHYEVLKNGKKINPAYYIQRKAG